jgi:hypothetical protein
MRKIRAEMPSNPQQNHLGMESNASIALDVATMTGPGCKMVAAGRVISDCVFFLFTAGEDTGDGFDQTVTRAVSFFGPGWTETPAKLSDAAGASAGESKLVVIPASDKTGVAPAGFGRGLGIGEAATFGGNTGGRCDEMMGVPVLTGDGGVIVGGDRRGGMADVRDGRRIRAVSGLALLWSAGVGSDRCGSSLGTGCFCGSAIAGRVALRKSLKILSMSLANFSSARFFDCSASVRWP